MTPDNQLQLNNQLQYKKEISVPFPQTETHNERTVSHTGTLSKTNVSNPSVDIKNKNPIKPLTFSLFKILSFALNFNYSVQNSIITMLMISFSTPNIVDSLIWTIPNIISILIRPYLIRYVHSVHKSHRIRSEAFLVNLFLFLGAIGALIIGQSALMNESKKGLYVNMIITKAFRIMVCSVGWTLTGISFQLCEYFIDKLKQSLEQQCYVKNASFKIQTPTKNTQTIQKTQKQSEEKQFLPINFQQQKSNNLVKNYKFLGSLAGYLLVLVRFALTSKNTLKMKSFFEQSNIIYTIVGFLTLTSSILCYVMISYSGIPKSDPETKPKPIPFKISFSPNYYLPGLSELKYMSPKGLSFLMVHFVVQFVMDVMFIYTTMWTTGSSSTTDMKQSQANFHGVKYGTFYLIVYTFVYYGEILPNSLIKGIYSFRIILVLSSIQLITCFWLNISLLYLPLVILLGLFYKIYEKQIQRILEQNQSQIKVSKQLVVRIQKFVVLNILPFVTMILLGRDDIQDCMIWCAVLIISITVILILTKLEKDVIVNFQSTQQQEKKKKE